MAEALRPGLQRASRDLRMPVRIALSLADALFCIGRQLAAFDRIEHSDPPRDGFLGCGAARFDVAPQTRRVRDAEVADDLPRGVVRSALGDDRAFLGGNALNGQ